MPRLTTTITLTSEQRTSLERWTRSRTLPQRRVMRARIILLAAESVPSRAIAQRLGIARQTVIDWEHRFLAQGIDGLEEARGRGRRPTIRQAKKDRVIALTAYFGRIRPGVSVESGHPFRNESGHLLGVNPATPPPEHAYPRSHLVCPC